MNQIVKPIIDCDADPFIPDGWTVEEHQKGGQFEWNKEAQKNALFFKEQKYGQEGMSDKEVRKALKDKKVLNANVLDFLLANPHLIPEEWKDKGIVFWGTVYYCKKSDSLGVRCLLSNELSNPCQWDWEWINGGLIDNWGVGLASTS